MQDLTLAFYDTQPETDLQIILRQIKLTLPDRPAPRLALAQDKPSAEAPPL